MALPPAITAAPVIPGWATSRADDGTYEAIRLEPLSAYQLAAGCRAVLNAGNVPELDRLCHAQRAYSELIALAEVVAS